MVLDESGLTPDAAPWAEWDGEQIWGPRDGEPNRDTAKRGKISKVEKVQASMNIMNILDAASC